MPLAVRFRVEFFNAFVIDTLMSIDRRGISGHQFLVEQFGDAVYEYFQSATILVRDAVKDMYENIPIGGRALVSKYTGTYGNRVLRRLRVHTTDTWPWAYVGLYPQPGHVPTVGSRDEQTYFLEFEFGREPGKEDFNTLRRNLRPWVANKLIPMGGVRDMDRYKEWDNERVIEQLTNAIARKIYRDGYSGAHLFSRVYDAVNHGEIRDEIVRRRDMIVDAINKGFGTDISTRYGPPSEWTSTQGDRGEYLGGVFPSPFTIQGADLELT